MIRMLEYNDVIIIKTIIYTTFQDYLSAFPNFHDYMADFRDSHYLSLHKNDIIVERIDVSKLKNKCAMFLKLMAELKIELLYATNSFLKCLDIMMLIMIS